ncbi:NUDIX hydrolase [candidate division TA06 bacterium]|uniref:NUDIX hydrolase n=1 Tax=candidate division TA06 bacterium TaxID=2250710 RepID=A0A933IC11_UNCT6|nr:NUDIX hydrolase [candidate division TA06 bacterium]
MDKWKITKRRQVYKNPWIAVREDSVKRPDGSAGRYGVVEVGDAVSIVALQNDGLCLVQQYRHSWGKRVWEVPCGGLHKGESALKAAQRELSEEAGIKAKKWKRLGIIESNDPVVNRFHLFLARDLSFASPRRDRSEAGMENRMWGLPDYKQALLKGAIRDDMTIACVCKALMAGGVKL